MSERLSDLLRAIGEMRAEIANLGAEVSRLRAEVVRSREEMASLRLTLSAPEQRLLPFATQPEEQLVSLDQAAAIARLKKRTLERHRSDGMPGPRFHGRRGQKSLYAWPEMRLWLIEQFGGDLPEVFPTLPPR